MFGFLVPGRVMNKIRIMVRDNVSVMFNVSVYAWEQMSYIQ